MKRFYKFLMPMVAIVALAMPWNVQAQLTTLVADGTTTNSYIPIYGLWADDYTRSQFIYPASMLEDLTPGSQISSLTFYSTTATQDWGAATFDVKLGEVTQTTLSGSYLTYPATTVYSGALTVSSSQMTITFTTPYVYQGGNLMVELFQTVTGTYHSVYFNGVSATGASASGYSSSGASSASFNQRGFLAKMQIEYVPGSGDVCYRVRDVEASAITSDGFTLSWSDTLNGGASYIIYDMSDTSVLASTSSTTYTFSGLDANTLYNIAVVADCGTSTSSYNVISVRTACGGFTAVPYSTTFDDVTDGELPQCWVAPMTGSSGSGTFPSVYNYSTNSYSSPKYFEFESNNGATELVALPSMENISQLALSFYASLQNHNFVLEVGVLDDTTFEVVDTINLVTSSNWHDGYMPYTVYFANYTGSGDRIALRVTASGSYTLMMDNFEVFEFSGCYPVSDLTASDIDSTSITLSWEDEYNSGATYTVTYWTAAGDTLVEYATDTTVTLTNLGANTMYYFSVEAVCATGAATAATGNWRTECGSTAIPYIEGFEGLTTSVVPSCWTLLSGNPRVNSSSSNAHTGSQYLHFSGGQPNTIALPPMNQPTGTLQVRFWTRPESYTSSSCGSFSVGYMTDINVDSTFVELANWAYNTFSAYEEKEVPMVGAPDTARIVLRHNSGSSSWYWYVDDLTVEPIPACNRPVSVSASNVTSDGADIAILGTSDAYRVYYTTGSTTDSIDIYDSVYTFTTLDASTNYTISVASICDDGSLTGTVSTSFRTLCGAGGCQVTIDMTDSYGDGWNGAAIYGYANGDQVFSATISSGNTGSFAYSHCATDTLVLRWHTGSYDNETGFTVAIGGTPVVTGSGSDYSNNELLYQTIGCPSCYAPNNITVGGITGTDAIVSWNANGGSNFRIYFNGGTTADSVDVTGDSTYTFTTLDPSTTYTLIVATICDDGSTSVANPVTFTTACAAGGCEVLISMVDGFGDGWNDATIYGYINSNNNSTFAATLTEGSAGSFSYNLCAVDTLTLIWSEGMYDDEIDFTVTVGGSIIAQVVGVYSSTGDTVGYTIGCPSCLSPTSFVLDSVSTDAAGFHWMPGATETEWFVTIDDSTFTTTASNVYVTGLSANTYYNVYVYSICGVDDTSMALHGGFRTSCGLLSIPYTEGFEGLTSNTAPVCWTPISGSVQVYNSSYNAHTGTNYLHFSGSANNSIALPEMSQPTGTLQVRLWTRPETFTSNYSGSFSVGYMTDLNVDSTFVAVATWNYSDFTDYEEREVAMVGAPDSARIVLRHTPNSTSWYWYVDDLMVEPMPDCPRPSALNATSVYHDQVDVAFAGSTSGDYIVYITDGASYSDSVSVTADSTHSFTGLTPLTTYTISVVADCGTSVSPNREITVTTTMVADTLPLSTGFEVGEDTAWMLINGTQTNQWVIGDAVSNGGSRALYISNDNGVSNSYSNTSTSNVYAMKLLSFDSIGDYTISYDWRANGESHYYDWLRVFLAPATVEFNAGSAMPLGSSTYNASTATVPAGWYDLNGHSTSPYTLNQSSSWNTVSSTFSLTAAGNYYLVFMWSNDASGGSNPPAAIDNVQLSRLSCPQPQNLTLDASDMTSLTFHWTPAGSESAWEVTVGTTTAIATTNSFTATGLSSSSSYNVSVRAICGAGDTSFAVNATFATSCGVVNSFPYFESFESAEAPANCWSLVYGDGSGTANPMTHYSGSAHDGNRVFRFSSYSSSSDYNQYLISPELSGSNLILSFWYMNYSSYGDDNIQVGYSTTTADTSAFIWGSWLNPGGNWTEFVDTMPANVKYFAIHYYGDYAYYTYVDDLTVDGNGSGCNAPDAVNATAAETTATLTWSGSANAYQVAAVAGNWVEPTAPVSVTGSSYTFTGLTPGTQYSLGVRSDCDSGLYSQWVVTTVTTAERPCPVPTDVHATATTVTSATIAWTPAEEGQTDFQLHITTPGADTLVDATGSSVTVTGLLANTAYTVTVRANCGAGVYSEWSAPATFTTNSCPDVTNVHMGTITTTTATVLWEGTADSYEVAYGEQGTTTEQCDRVTTTSTSYTITGLESGSIYVVYVRSICGGGAYGEWADETTFTTAEENGIDDIDNANISLYPNPASSTVTLSGLESQAQVTIVDMNGREVYSGMAADGRLTINVSGMTQGAYFVRITGEQVNAIRKLIVK